MQTFGYEVNGVAGQPDVVEVELGAEGKILVDRKVHDNITALADNAAEYYTEVLRAKNLSHEEWQAKRGEESELASHMEEGTPTTDHGGAPPAEEKE